MKLWEKGIETNKLVEQFTVGLDREMDQYIAAFDVLGNMAHIKMLESIGLIEKADLEKLLVEFHKKRLFFKNTRKINLDKINNKKHEVYAKLHHIYSL